MDATLIVHGMSNGQTIWNVAPEENAYIGNFYQANANGTHLCVHVRNWNGKSFVYYHYLIYPQGDFKIIPTDNRNGTQYFGLTLRLDELCTDFRGIYNLLESVFNTQIVGKVLKRDGKNLRYQYADLATGCDGYLQKAEETLLSLMGAGFIGNDSFRTNILSGFNNTGNQSIPAFLYEIAPEDCVNYLKRGTGLLLSPYFPARSTKEKIYQLNHTIQQQQQQAAEELRKATNASNAEAQAAHEKVKRLESQLQNKDDKINQLNSQIAQHREDSKIQQKIEQIKPTIIDLANMLNNRPKKNGPNRIQDPHYGGSNPYPPPPPRVRDDRQDKGFFSSPLFYVALLFGFIFIIAVLFFFKGCNIPFLAEEEQKEDVSKGANPQPSAVGETTNYPATGATNMGVSNNTMAHDDVKQIDIAPYNGTHLRKDSTYTLTANGGNSWLWELNGADVKEGHLNNKVIKIVPNDSVVEIKCTIDGILYQRSPQKVE